MPEDRRRQPNQDKETPPKHEFTEGLYGQITHTDLASNDPNATKEWCRQVLGWNFTFTMPVANGDMYMFAYSERGGGGIRPVNPPEIPGSIPYVHVQNCAKAFESGLKQGAEEMMPPTRVMEGVTVAIVRVPGGVPIGFSGP